MPRDSGTTRDPFVGAGDLVSLRYAALSFGSRVAELDKSIDALERKCAQANMRLSYQRDGSAKATPHITDADYNLLRRWRRDFPHSFPVRTR